MPGSCLLLVVFLPLYSVQALAGDLLDGSWYIAGAVSYIDDDVDRNRKDGLVGYHLGLGKNLTRAISIEGNLVSADYESSGTREDQEQLGLGLDLIGKLRTDGQFVPYVFAGAGIIHTQGGKRGPMASVGVGVLTPIKLFGMSLRTELRARTDNSQSDSSSEFLLRDVLLTVGLQRTISRKPKLFRDSDGDEVADLYDRCGNTPPNTAIDRYGCALTPDKDGDGVPDNEDVCGDSPAGSKVDKFGCALSDDSGS